MDKFKEFEQKLQVASLADLLDSLVLYSKTMDDDLQAYECVKLIKRVILERFGIA